MVNKLKQILKDKDRRRGIIGTIIVHVIILVALFILALRTPLPLPGEEGVEVNFGYDDRGYGDIQRETPPPVRKLPSAQPKPQKIEQPEPPSPPKEVVTQETEEAPAIEEPKKKEKIKEEPEEIKKEEKPEEPVEKVEEKKPDETPVDSTAMTPEKEVVEEPEKEPEPVVNTKALYTGTSKSKKGSNQGVKQGSGDMGKPQGYKDSNKYDGRGGEGNGISFSLGGRGSKYLERPSAKFSEVGTVVVNIWVDRNGNVTKAQVSPRGTTIINQKQRQIAVDAAKNSTFTADASAPETQRGTITYTFILMK